jgi:hypothetical protein
MAKIKRFQLEQWLGNNVNNSEYLVTMLHELLTGEYDVETFKSDVSAYDVDEEEEEEDTINRTVYDKLAEHTANDETEFSEIIKNLKKELIDNPNGLVDYVETISVLEADEYKYTTKQFCELIGLK